MRKAGRLSNDDIANAMKVAKQGGLISQSSDNRFAADRLDSLIDDAYEHLEQKRQIEYAKAIHGGEKELKAFMTKGNPSQTAEQQIARDLVFKGIEPDTIPADKILGKDVTDAQLGIDGSFRPDSEVRRHVTGGMQGDLLNLDRTDVRTEILSPQGIQESFDAWKPNAFKDQDSRSHFNMAGQEYYGQQALKLLGNTPVEGHNRSGLVRRANGKGNAANTVDTDRLVENSVRLRDKDVSQSADFRYMSPDGKLTVSDYQVGTLNDDRTVNLNILKKSNITRENLPQFEQEMVRVAQKLESAGVTPELDMIFSELQKEGKLAPTVMRTNDEGTRPGKFMSDAPIMGDVNFDDQHRMAGVLYGMVEPGSHDQLYGMLPQQFRYYSSPGVRKHIGKMYAKGEVVGEPFIKNDRLGNLYFKAGTSGDPEGKLGKDLNRQFSEPYSFDSLNSVVQMAQRMDRPAMPPRIDTTDIPF